MGARLGMEAKLYHNEGTYASPTWTEITNLRDVTVNMEKGDADVTTRANGGWRALKAALKEANIEFEMVWDTADAGFTVVQDSFFAGTPVEFAIMDGDIATVGTEGLRATCEVFGFSKNEPLEEAQTVGVTIKPTYSANPPEWMEISS